MQDLVVIILVQNRGMLRKNVSNKQISLKKESLLPPPQKNTSCFWYFELCRILVVPFFGIAGYRKKNIWGVKIFLQISQKGRKNSLYVKKKTIQKYKTTFILLPIVGYYRKMFEGQIFLRKSPNRPKRIPRTPKKWMIFDIQILAGLCKYPFSSKS